ncbi:MAG: O-antigen ligase family protein, partial [Deltaproteobacteria bacterium]|nr:O-antigen ligase family protein [Deltaproteobacteria bacterium]
EESSAKPRLDGTRQALRMFSDHPLLGVGLAQYGGVAIGDAPGALTPRQIDAVVTFNLYVELIAENGLLGLAIVLAGLLLCARGVFRAWRRGERALSQLAGAVLLASCVIFGVMYQFNQTLFRTEAWCLIGLACAIDRAHRDPEAESPSAERRV